VSADPDQRDQPGQRDPRDERTATEPRGGVAGVLPTLLDELADAPAPELGAGWVDWLRPGAEVGRYQLVREIGRGGFGVVWEARDREDGDRPVAFKAVRAGRGAQVRAARLVQEAELAARLCHPNIVELRDVGRCPYGPYLVMELLDGVTLEQRLAGERLSVAEALHIAVEVVTAAAHAHRHGVVHRDLKPGNVFLQDHGSVKVLDFGMAHAFGHRKAAGGTPAYMAPEQWRGAPEDERTDVFALGVILFRMLADQLPFPGDDGAELCGPRPAPIVEVAEAPALGELVARMLDKDPVERPRDAGEVLPALIEVEQTLGRAAAGGVAPRVALHADVAAAVRAEECYRRGRRFLRQTRKASLQFARDLFARAVELDPGNALAHAGLAEAIAQIHMYYPSDQAALERADRESQLALTLRDDRAETHVARGLVLFLLDQPEPSSAHLARAVALDPRLFEAHYYTARVHFQEGRIADAEAAFRAAHRAREDYQAAFFTAQACEAQGHHDDARAAYREALAVAERHMELNPDDPRAATTRAVALCRIGRVDEGLHWAEQALTLDPRDAGVRYNVACLYALAGATERALTCLEEVVAAGFGTRGWMEKDPDLDSLRDHPRFRRLLAAP